MSVTCIICLGDLGESASDPRAIVAAEGLPRPDHHGIEEGGEGAAVLAASPVSGDDVKNDNEDNGQIARLLPCAHILHNNCLKPWVERANSCPICRRSFNVVELSDHVGGRSG